jgi:predicted transcriptional regulator
MKLNFKDKEKRNRSVTIRLTETTVTQLKALADAYDQSQAEVISALIELAFESLKKPKKK